MNETRIPTTEEIIMDGMNRGKSRQEIWDACYTVDMPFFVKEELEHKFDSIIRTNVELLKKMLAATGHKMTEKGEKYFASLLEK